MQVLRMFEPYFQRKTYAGSRLEPLAEGSICRTVI